MHISCKEVQTGRYLPKTVRGKLENSSILHLEVSLVRVYGFTAVQPHVDFKGHGWTQNLRKVHSDVVAQQRWFDFEAHGCFCVRRPFPFRYSHPKVCVKETLLWTVRSRTWAMENLGKTSERRLGGAAARSSPVIVCIDFLAVFAVELSLRSGRVGR